MVPLLPAANNGTTVENCCRVLPVVLLHHHDTDTAFGSFSVAVVCQATIAVNLWQWITRWFTWVDIISLVPMIIMAFGPDQSDDFDLLRIVRLMRLLRVMRAHRMLYITPSGSISREIALLVYTISVLVLIAAGFFHVIEPGIQTFHDGIYFVVVTITTLGYVRGCTQFGEAGGERGGMGLYVTSDAFLVAWQCVCTCLF